MVSATRPVLDAGGRFIGVAGVDLSLKDIRGRLASLQLPEAERVAGEEIYVVSRRGKVIVHPNERLMLGESFDDEDLKKLPGGTEVAARASGTSRVGSGAKGRRLTWATARLTGWKVVLSAPSPQLSGVGNDMHLHPRRDLGREGAVAPGAPINPR